MKHYINTIKFWLTLLFCVCCQTMFAQIVAYDFNSGAQGWSLTGAAATGGRIFMDGGSTKYATSPLINLAGITQAQVSVDWNCVDVSSGFESDDFISVSYWNGSAYVELWSRNGDQICPNANNNQTGNTGNILLPAGISSTYILLTSTANSTSEDIYWDNVILSLSLIHI